MCVWGGGVRGPPPENFRKTDAYGAFWDHLSQLRVNFLFLKKFIVCHKSTCVKSTWNGFFSFTEGMVLDSHSSLEVGEAAAAFEFFWENGIKWCFLKPFSADCIFKNIFIYVFYFFFLPSSPELEGLWLRSFSWLIGIMLVQKGRTISPIFYRKKTFFMEMRNSCMFSKLSEINIPFLFYVIFTGNFGDSRYLVLIDLELPYTPPPPPPPGGFCKGIFFWKPIQNATKWAMLALWRLGRLGFLG